MPQGWRQVASAPHGQSWCCGTPLPHRDNVINSQDESKSWLHHNSIILITIYYIPCSGLRPVQNKLKLLNFCVCGASLWLEAELNSLQSIDTVYGDADAFGPMYNTSLIFSREKIRDGGGVHLQRILTPIWAPECCFRSHCASRRTAGEVHAPRGGVYKLRLRAGRRQLELGPDCAKVRTGFSSARKRIGRQWPTKHSNLLTFTWRNWPHPSSWTSGNTSILTVSAATSVI